MNVLLDEIKILQGQKDKAVEYFLALTKLHVLQLPSIVSTTSLKGIMSIMITDDKRITEEQKVQLREAIDTLNSLESNGLKSEMGSVAKH